MGKKEIEKIMVTIVENPNAAMYVAISIAVVGVASLIRLCLKMGMIEQLGKPVKAWKVYDVSEKIRL